MMKKITVIVLAMLLVLVVGQSAFAKNYVGLTVGYAGAQVGQYNEEDSKSLRFADKGFKIGLFANYYLMESFSLAGEVRVNAGTEKAYDDDWFNHKQTEDNKYRYVMLHLNLFGRYDVFNLDTANVGVQAGFIHSTDLWKIDNETEPMFTSYIALGAYGNVNVMPKLNIYADFKFPIGFWNKNYTNDQGLFKIFLYDVVFGATYEISPNIHLGIEGNIGNLNDDGLWSALEKKYDKEDNNTKDENSYFNFSIGAKVGYSF